MDELKTRLAKFVQESLSIQYQQRAKPRLMDLYVSFILLKSNLASHLQMQYGHLSSFVISNET